MSFAAKKLATYEDLLAVPEGLVAELIGGELVTQPRPASRHARAGSRLGALLDGPFDRGSGGPGGWLLLDEPELHLGSEVLVPDLGGWRRERMPEMPDVAYFELAPDFCCEILSPSTAQIDRVRKMPVYAQHGVGHVWLVDPVLRSLEVFALDGQSYRVTSAHAEAEVVHAPPFDAIGLDLSLLWQR